jgi:sulfur-oxidizing protein SoxX
MRAKTLMVCWTALLIAVGMTPMATADTLGPFVVVDETIAAPLSAKPGDPQNGRAIAAGRQGNCLGCHRLPIPEEPFHGTVGPNLAGVGDRYSPAELRLRLVDSTMINPETIMPPFHRVDELRRVARRYRGKPILTAQEIEDVIAYLITLKKD